MLHSYGLSSVCILYVYKIIISCKNLITLAALIWSLPSVSHDMIFKKIIPCESFATLAALVWSLPSVCPYMLCKDIILCESFVTMVLKTFFLWAILIPLTAFVSFHSCVWSHICNINTLLYDLESLITLADILI